MPECQGVSNSAGLGAYSWRVLDVIPLVKAVDQLADRLRSMPQSRLRGGSAAAGRVLADELARRAQRLETPKQQPRALPTAEDFAVGDQLAVAGHDLAEALRALGTQQELDEARDLLTEGARKIH